VDQPLKREGEREREREGRRERKKGEGGNINLSFHHFEAGKLIQEAPDMPTLTSQ